MFDRLSGGKDTVSVDALPDWVTRFRPDTKQKMTDFLKSKGVTNGQMTRALYTEFVQAQTGQGGGAQPAGGTTAPAAKGGDDEVTKAFNALDRNGDGKLDSSEMPPEILRNLTRWDTNGNGTIELNEFRAYHVAQQQRQNRNNQRGGRGGPWGGNPWGGGQGGQPWWQGQQPAAPAEEPPPTVYKVGKLPKGLPQWFEPMDTDKDGQIGLYEWKASGRPVSEFLAIDANGDGFITVEEMLRYQKSQPKQAGGRGTTGQSPTWNDSDNPGSDAGANFNRRGGGGRRGGGQRRGGG
jgi:hypothetical protein